jgi:hypothetical protein
MDAAKLAVQASQIAEPIPRPAPVTIRGCLRLAVTQPQVPNSWVEMHVSGQVPGSRSTGSR